MKRKRRRKCVQCARLYHPDPRNAYHQRYCPEPSCQAASRAHSRQRWLRKPENRDYHRGKQQVERVRAWRKAHPGYWRKGRALQDVCSLQNADSKCITLDLDSTVTDEVSAEVQPLQDGCSSQHADGQAIDQDLGSSAPAKTTPLQDVCLAQVPLFVGLVSKLTGALPDDMGTIIANLDALGRTLLGKGPGFTSQGGQYGAQACFM